MTIEQKLTQDGYVYIATIHRNISTVFFGENRMEVINKALKFIFNK